MTALHTPATVAAAPNGHPNAAHVRPHDRQVLLDLIRDADRFHGAPAVRTRLGQRDVDRVINMSRRTAMAMPPMPATAAAARFLGAHRRGTFRERRRLSFAGPTHGLQRARQALDLTPQPIPLALQPLAIPLQFVALPLQPRVIVAESVRVLTESFRFSARLLDLTAHTFQFTLRVIARPRGRALRHATVMADSQKKYKPKLWIGAANPLTSYSSPWQTFTTGC
jgi:hypothetical protein